MASPWLGQNGLHVLVLFDLQMPAQMHTNWQARRMLLLQEATELSQLFQSIEPAFAAGELQKIADMLATMRRSLKLVGNVPEFSGGMEKLQARGTSAIADPHDNTHTLWKAYSRQ